jgi:hypothetical protein
MKKSFTYYAFWAVFLGLLATMLPHTQWAFRQLEPVDSPALWTGSGWTGADLVAAAAAFAFEAGLAVFVHRLSRRIEKTRKVYKPVKNADGSAGRVEDIPATIAARYLNIFTVGVIFCAFVSGLANYTHALQFSVQLAVFEKVLFFRNLYPLALGAALPVVSLIFASALSNISEEEHGEDPALVDARAQKAELAKQLRETSNRLKEASERLATLESQLAERDAATSDQVAGLESRLADSTNRLAEQAQALADAGPLALLRTGTKREIVLAARQLFPELNKAGLAAIAKCHNQYVSQVLAEEPIPVSLDVTAEYAEAER